ncbi:hypothetical protein TSAR_013335 [Trichomalopsis sarcophagae]|uniref:Uncharacterized protein n=1 Tax=Trichomalopsis sarcophagae TaxID=543379 RepID=A0A232EQV6_9HYME|nr:hypothetical protein TSAR_013335 [Trichomalopsis sarcophagae]
MFNLGWSTASLEYIPRKRDLFRLFRGAPDCDITQLSAENRSECFDVCVSTSRARERRLQGRMLIELPRSLSSKFHNCVNRYRDFKNPGTDPLSALLRRELLTGGYS